MVTQLNQNLAQKAITVSVADEAKKWILNQTLTDRSYGARPLRRALQKYIEDPLSEALIQGTITTRPAFIEVFLEDNKLFYRPVDRGEDRGRAAVREQLSCPRFNFQPSAQAGGFCLRDWSFPYSHATRQLPEHKIDRPISGPKAKLIPIQLLAPDRPQGFNHSLPSCRPCPRFNDTQHLVLSERPSHCCVREVRAAVAFDLAVSEPALRSD